MNNIKVYKEILNIELKDGTIVNSEKSLQELNDFLKTAGDFIEIGGVLFNKYEFKKAQVQKCDEVDSYILSLSDPHIRNKLKEKKMRLKNNMSKEMTLEYAQNFVNQL